MFYGVLHTTNTHVKLNVLKKTPGHDSDHADPSLSIGTAQLIVLNICFVPNTETLHCVSLPNVFKTRQLCYNALSFVGCAATCNRST